MKSLGSIKILVNLLAEATLAVVPKRKRKPKVYPVSLVFFEDEQALGIVEARHGLAGYRVPAHGHWPPRIQVDGRTLLKLVETYPSAAELELVALETELALLYEKSQVRLKRLDPKGEDGIELVPPPQSGEHKGPVEVPPDLPPSGRFAWNDTWLFSARVPFPQHRDSTDD